MLKSRNNDEFSKELEIAFLNKYNLHLKQLLEEAGIKPDLLFDVQTEHDRVLMEKHIKATEDRYRNILDNMREGCAILDFDWNYIYVNPENARHAHLSQEEMIGRNMLELIPGVVESDFFKAYKRCMDERTPQNIESSFTFPNGTTQWFECRVMPIPEGIFVLVIETTERKLKEISLVIEQNIFRRVLEVIPAAVFVLDINGNLILQNKMADVIWDGLKYESTDDLPLFKGIYAQNGEPVIDWASEKARRGEETINEELIIPLKDGTFRNIYNSAVPVFNEKGEVDFVIVVCVDISLLKKKEKELLQAGDQLKLNVKEKESLLNEYRQALKDKEMLFREVHHRIKNNMQVIMSLLGIQSSYFTESNVIDAFDESISRIKSMSLVHEQLYKSQKLSSISFDKYIKVLIGNLSSSYTTKNLEIKLVIEEEEIILSFDAAQNIGLVINELIINSIKHAFPGRDNGRISIAIAKDINNIYVTISDDGVGKKDKLLSSNSFGMELVTELLEQYDCSLETIIDKGTTYKITLPIKKAVEGIKEIKI